MQNSKGNLIAELRKSAGYTQKSLADALHITDKAVSKWERGLSLPDVSVLPKLSLLLGADMSLLLAPEGKRPHEGWCGLIDLRNHAVDLRQMIYDKPMVYFLLSHFLLLNVRKVCVLTSAENEEYLKNEIFSALGLEIVFNFEECANYDLMILNRPCFLFGSDLTRQFQGAMVSETAIKLVPENLSAPFLFCPAEYVPVYQKNPDYLYDVAVARTLGRGMFCIDMDGADQCMDVANFVKVYQTNSGLLIGCLEEIAYRKGILSKEKALQLTKNASYLKQLISAVEGAEK